MNKFKNLDGITEIIVLVKNNNFYTWYCSDKIFWVMDYARYARGFDPTDNDFSERFDIGLLNEFSVSEFLQNMKEFEASFQDLQHLFQKSLPLASFDEAYHLFPKVFVDFDSKELYSVYSELLHLEEFAPPTWKSYYSEFYDLVPNSIKYWIINGIDYREALG